MIEEKENKFLQRYELELCAKGFNSTPSKKELKEMIAALKGCKEENVFIEKIKQHYGSTEATIYAKVYKKAELMNKLHKLGKKAQTKPDEQKTEAVAEQTKAEAM